MSLGDTLFSEADIRHHIESLSQTIFESISSKSNVVLLGILSRGFPIAQRLSKYIFDHHGLKIPVGGLDVGLYRDDLLDRSDYVTIQNPGLSVGINGKHVILVDDVCFSGRTVRAALNALMDFGRPAHVDLAVLYDRPYRELPIMPTFISHHLDTIKSDRIRVHLTEVDGEDCVMKLSCEK